MQKSGRQSNDAASRTRTAVVAQRDGRMAGAVGMPQLLRAASPDRETRAFLRWWKLSKLRPLEGYSVQQFRAVWRVTSQVLGRRPPVDSVRDQSIAGPGGPIGLRIYTPSRGDKLRPAFLWCHGGGFIVGGLESADSICRNIARAAGCVVVSVRYRLSPEHDLHASRNDFLAALDWVALHGEALGIDTTRLAIGGDSAGGNVSAAVAQATVRRGGPALWLQVLAYPATDLAHKFPSMAENAGDYLLTPEALAYIEGQLGVPPDISDPWLSPRRSADLRGLPPALIVSAGYDPIRDDALDYAARLRAAGVPVELLHYAGQVHGFLNFDAVIGAAEDGLQRIGKALAAAFRGLPAADRTTELSDKPASARQRLWAAGSELVTTSYFAWMTLGRWSVTLPRLLSPRLAEIYTPVLRPWLLPASFVRRRIATRFNSLAARQTYPEI